MRALIWLVEDTWEATIDASGALVPADAEVMLLHVAPADVEAVAHGARAGLLGRPRHHRDRQQARHPPAPPTPALEAITDETAAELLNDAHRRFGRAAILERRRGRVEQEVVALAASADLLIMARDGDRSRPGPHSFGPRGRFVVDHAACAVVVVWPG